MEYRDLLNKVEWKNKRKQILERDIHTCDRCGISKTTFLQTLVASNIQSPPFTETGSSLNSNMRIINVPDDSLGIIVCKTNLNHFEIKTSTLSLVINTAVKGKIPYPYQGSTIPNHETGIIDTDEPPIRANMLLNKHFPKNEPLFNWEIDRHGIYLIKSEQQREFIKSQILHVHHKCYRATKEIWDQNDNEYISLCNACHRIVHETQAIPFYNSKDEISHVLTPCVRCSGQRYIECYKHRDGGICYQCNGQGFC